MLTIFTIPKPFNAETTLMQRNAIESWRRIGRVQIILCGDDEGVADAADEFECEHYPSLKRTPLGTPLLDDAFAAAQQMARNDLICYVNADIILLGGFQSCVSDLEYEQFLIAGRRINIWLSAEIPFEREEWAHDLWESVGREGEYAQPTGSDYFLFRRGTLDMLPPFAVGRPYWDNWMMYMARERGWPLIDATSLIRAIHQNHGYGHVPSAAGGMWQGPEGDENLRAAEGQVYTLLDATHALGPHGLTPLNGSAYRLRRIRRRLEHLPGWRVARSLYRFGRALAARTAQ